MNKLNIQEAQEALGIELPATTQQIMSATERILSKSVMTNQVQLAYDAIDANAVIMVAGGLTSQASADQLVATMRNYILRSTAQFDQVHEHANELQEVMIEQFGTQIELEESHATATDKLNRAVAKRDDLLSQYETARFRAARWEAAKRIRRRKFIKRFMSIFNKEKR